MSAFEPLLTLLGIALPSALVVLAIRRWFEPVPWRMCGVLFALVLITVGRGVFSPDMPVALDEVVRGYPYRGVFGPVTSKNPDTNDTVKQILPWMQVVREEFQSRRVPLWNRYSFSGYPLLGNAQSAPFSPFFLLTLFVPLPKQLVAIAGLKMCVALLFGFLVIRRETSTMAAAFGTVVYSLSIFQNVYLYYPLSAVTSLLPAVCYAVARVLDDGKWRSFVLLAIVVACTLIAGHPESAAHVAMGVMLFLTVELAAPLHRVFRGRILAAFGGALAGACLSASAFLPVFEEVLHSQRLVALTTGVRHAVVYPAATLWVLLNPDGFGNPALGNWRWYMHYIMVAPLYLGLIPLTLIPLALLPGFSRRDRVLLAIVLVMLLLAMNWTLLGQLLHKVPPFTFAANDRLRFVAIFFTAILSARIVDRLARIRSLLPIVSLIVVLTLAIYVFVRQFGTTLSVISSIGIVAVFGFWITWFLKKQKALPTVALIATSIELIVFNWPFNAMTSREYYEPQLPIIDAIHRQQPLEPFRIVGADWTFLPNASAQYRLEDIRGSDPMAWAPYTEFFRLIQAPGQELDVGRVIDVNHPAVRFLNVLFLVAEPESSFPSPWRRIYRGPDGDLYRHDRAIPRFFAPTTIVGPRDLRTIADFGDVCVVEGLRQNEVRTNSRLIGMWLREMNPQRFRMAIDAAGPLFIASSQPAAPGWKV
ncbi:MAG TPA: YfhO family protein, partial [Thermoanaerobaculia bacterium]